MSYPPAGMLGPLAIALWALRTQADGVELSGLEHVPARGPVLLVARHYHHLLDGAVLVRHLGRPAHIVVGLDWAADAGQRRLMERLCGWAQYPVILRPRSTGQRAGYRPEEVARYLRRGLRQAAELLRDGRVVVVFPEGYPVVDPSAPVVDPGAPAVDPNAPAAGARDADGMRPFAAGFETIARLARRLGAAEVPLVPLGLRYTPRGKRWRIAARFGPPLPSSAGAAELERAVRELSR